MTFTTIIGVAIGISAWPAGVAGPSADKDELLAAWQRRAATLAGLCVGV